MRFICFAAYFGIGAMMHALFVGPHFDFSNVWTWAWLFGWPAGLFFYGAAAVIAFIVGAGIVVILFLAYEELRLRFRSKRR
jgi:hypothetical protein